MVISSKFLFFKNIYNKTDNDVDIKSNDPSFPE